MYIYAAIFVYALPEQEAIPAFLHALCISRHRMGNQHSYGNRISLCGPGQGAVRECSHSWRPALLVLPLPLGPGLMIVAFQIIRRYTNYKIEDETLQILRQIVTISLFVNLFLLSCEAFKEFYAESVHSSSARYLFFGLDGYTELRPWIWSAITIETIAAVILLIPPVAKNGVRERSLHPCVYYLDREGDGDDSARLSANAAG
jgi:hypothetical protein